MWKPGYYTGSYGLITNDADPPLDDNLFEDDFEADGDGIGNSDESQEYADDCFITTSARMSVGTTCCRMATQREQYRFSEARSISFTIDTYVLHAKGKTNRTTKGTRAVDNITLEEQSHILQNNSLANYRKPSRG
ncbi:hypothetical protein SARC_01682 [Sphaeroforma arctica JP610]|uniref:Uncharacterized protein n=1 Tax=Sphaeroforma arctica JP610 TaxID=667725 RepID=A0A0L0GB92_9EUKA|nr:hypothetical protein SARC_01682 [Sphaeroforma arctica JP610]KNC86156.1 hypothetical protein SARC_01682 [Sphaeroforma arctica JP610]|eukprot:XP_014160058.1 hypothetical protein SARC_01682 [Sphaeroforma arctica JP610]